MMLVQFLKTLKKLDGKWKLNRNGFLRKGLHCPLTYVYYKTKGKRYGAHKYATVAIELGLRWDMALKIVNAADRHGEEKLRRKLLKAVGLKEAK